MSNNNENLIVLYQTGDGKITINVRFENDTFWLTQKAIAELFDSERSVITKHLQNIYEEEELGKEATCAKITQVQTEGSRDVTRMLEFYNLESATGVHGSLFLISHFSFFKQKSCDSITAAM